MLEQKNQQESADSTVRTIPDPGFPVRKDSRTILSFIGALIRQRFQRVNDEFGRTEKTQTFLRGSIGSIVLWACSLGIRVLLSIVLTRILGVESYGIYAYAITWLAVIAIPTVLGFDHITLRYVAVYRETSSWASMAGLLRFSFLIVIGTSLTVGAVSIAITTLLPGIQPGSRVSLIFSLAILPVVVLSQVRQSILRGLDRPALAQLPENIVYPVLLMIILLFSRRYTGTFLTAPAAALANAAAWVAAFTLGGLILRSALPPQVRRAEPVYEKRDWIRMIPPLILTGAAYQLLSKGDLLVLGMIGSPQDVGVYAVASRGAEQFMTIFYTVAGFAGASLFSRIYASGDMKELQRFASLITKSIFWLSLPLYLALLGFASQFLALYGQEFVRGVTVMRLLSTTYFLSTLSGFIIIMLYNTGHQRDVAATMGLMAAFNIGLSFILVPIHGMLGAAIASGTSLLLLHGILVAVLYHRVGVLSLPLTFERTR